MYINNNKVGPETTPGVAFANLHILPLSEARAAENQSENLFVVTY